MIKPNYEISFEYNGELYTKRVIAFDIGITNPGCITLILTTGVRFVLDMIGMESYNIESLVEKW